MMYYLTEAFSSLKTKFKKKGGGTHIKEIQAFQRYLKTLYNTNKLSQTIFDAAHTLKEKLVEKIPKLKFPSYVAYKYAFAL